jgi:hypothetical protein
MDTKQTSTDELFKTLVVELITRALREQVEPLVEARVQTSIAETEARAYSDAEVCKLLGGISRTSLWRLRKRYPLLKPRALFPGGPHRTTLSQIRDYIASIEVDDGEVINLDDHRSTRTSKPRVRDAASRRSA